MANDISAAGDPLMWRALTVVAIMCGSIIPAFSGNATAQAPTEHGFEPGLPEKFYFAGIELSLGTQSEQGTYVVEALVESHVDLALMNVVLELPPELQIAGGNLTWSGPMAAEIPVTVSITVRPLQDGEYFIVARGESQRSSAVQLHPIDELRVVAKNGQMTEWKEQEEIIQIEIPEIFIEDVHPPSLEDLTDPQAAAVRLHVQGQATVKDRFGTNRPLVNVDINIYDVDTAGDVLVSEGFRDTDSSGNFHLHPSNCDACFGDTGSGGIELKIGIQAYGTFIGGTHNEDGDIYIAKSANLGAFPDETVITHNMNLDTPEHRLYRSVQQSQAKWQGDGASGIGHAHVVWPISASHPQQSPHFHMFTAPLGEIHLPATYDGGEISDWPDVVHHEWGHQVLYDVFDETVPWGSNPCPGGTPYDDDINAECAFNEGWAQFMSLYPDNSGLWESQNTDINHEFSTVDGQAYAGSGDDTPFRITDTFWDLYDNNPDGFNTGSGSEPGPDMFQFASQFNSRIVAALNAEASNLAGYRDDWNSLGFGAKYFISAVQPNTITYDTADPTAANIVQPEAGCTYVNDVKGVCTGTTTLIGTQHTVKVDGSDAIGIWQLELYVDGLRKAKCNDVANGADCSWVWQLAGSVGGGHTITVKVWDFQARSRTFQMNGVVVAEE